MNDLFSDMPFNLSGESLNAEYDAREDYHAKCVREKAESEARKAQRVFPLHDETNENAL